MKSPLSTRYDKTYVHQLHTSINALTIISMFFFVLKL